MTTYELPPEPPVGSRVRDHHGHVWTHTNDGWSHPDLRSSGLSWGAVMAYASPAELIEPDTWPTEPLIVADWIAGAAKGHGLLYLDGHEYVTIESGHVLREGRDTLTNVVPVTVVSVAGLEALRDAVKALGYETTGMPGSLLDTALNLLSAADALGLD